MASNTNLQSDHLELLADVGFTGHLGGLEATAELAAACDIGEGDLVLDVGCGTGTTPRYLASEYGCRVVGVDVSPKMVGWAQAGIEGGRPQFAVADGTQLPFETGRFDAVISESVLAFVDDKRAALAEYERVVGEGGFVGVNEATWLDEGPHDRTASPSGIVTAAFETVDGWTELFADVGFAEHETRLYRTSLGSLLRSELRRHGVAEVASVALRFAKKLLTDPAFRRGVKSVASARQYVTTLLDSIGYGLYVGKVA